MNIYKKRRANLRLLIDERANGNAAEFARMLDLTRSQVGQYLSEAYNEGRSIGEKVARRIEESLGLEPLWLDFGGDPQERALSSTSRSSHVHLPILEVSPAAGAGRDPVDYPAVIDYLEVPEVWALHRLGRDLSKYRVLPVSGDSMSPTINDGDLVFVDTNVTSYQTNGIYVIIWHGRLLIKRLRASLSSGKIEIASDNESAYPTESVSPEELNKLHICGFVKCWWSIKGA